MNILQILPKLDVGGVETGTIDLAKELTKRGHRCFVVSGGGRMVKELESLNIKHIEIAVHKKSPIAIIKCIRRLEDVIREHHVDIVHGRSRVPAIIAFFASRHTGARFITTAHGYYSTHILSRVIGWARFIVVASGVIGRHMMNDFNVPRERIRFIPRGVDLERFKFNPFSASVKSEYKIAVIGRITPIKGHAFFLQAIARVVHMFPKVRVLIVGEPPLNKPEYLEKLKHLTRQLGINKFVEFLGSRQDIPEIMGGLDLVVLPSTGQEAFGRVLIEAGASGVPVIATRVGGIVEIVEDGRTGLLVKPGDILEMVEAIIKLLKDRNLARDFAAGARKKVEREYSLQRMAEETIKLYEDACDVKRILVIKIGAIGDVMLVVPSLRILRKSFPRARISVLIGAESTHILKACPYIDELLIFDRGGSTKGIKGLLRAAREIRRKYFDISIDFQNNKTSHMLAWLGAIPERFGYDNGKLGFFINNRVKYLNISVSPVTEQFRLLKRLGIDTLGASTYLEMWPTKDDFSYIENLLKDEWVREGQIIVGINIGASQRWETKTWPLGNLVKLSNMLAEKDIRTVITGSRADVKKAKDFMAMAQAKPINAVGKTTLGQLAALIKRCRIFITGDSAPMHMASSMAADFIALFGPTDPARHFEPTQKGVYLKKDIECSPCYKSKCKHKMCMERIRPEEVYRLIMEKI